MSNLDAIRDEIARSNVELDGRPLPLASCWQGGAFGPVPNVQRQYLADGHYWLPNFGFPLPRSTGGYFASDADFRNFFRELAGEDLPFTLMHTQIEDCLRREVYPGCAWHLLPKETTGLGLDLNGEIEEQRRVDPLGPIGLWREVGAAFVGSEHMDWMQGTYPNPPRVILLSNNESPKVHWTNLNSSGRFVAAYGGNADYELRSQVYARGIRERTQAMNDALRSRLSHGWTHSSRFVGYAVAGGPFFGRWDGWPNYISYLPAPLHFYHDLGWQGGSQREVYVGQHDTTTYSPQGQSQQLPFQDAICDAAQPEWFRETSVWEQTADYRELNYPGGKFTPARYLGMMRWLLWIQRPRVLRQFDLHATPLADVQPWLDQVLRAVREVHENDILRAFWRKGELIPERSRPSPWRYTIPPALANVDRNFLLRTDQEAEWPENVYPTNWVVNVWAMAFQLGEEFLLYVQAPEGTRTARVTIPDAGEVSVEAPQEGAFYHLSFGWQTTRVV